MSSKTIFLRADHEISETRVKPVIPKGENKTTQSV